MQEKGGLKPMCSGSYKFRTKDAILLDIILSRPNHILRSATHKDKTKHRGNEKINTSLK